MIVTTDKTKIVNLDLRGFKFMNNLITHIYTFQDWVTCACPSIEQADEIKNLGNRTILCKKVTWTSRMEKIKIIL